MKEGGENKFCGRMHACVGILHCTQLLVVGRSYSVFACSTPFTLPQAMRYANIRRTHSYSSSRVLGGEREPPVARVWLNLVQRETCCDYSYLASSCKVWNVLLLLLLDQWIKRGFRQTCGHACACVSTFSRRPYTLLAELLLSCGMRHICRANFPRL